MNPTQSNLHTDNGTHGLVLVGADADGHNGYVRGIGGQAGTYVATTGATSRCFKTLNGAVTFMARRGFDAYGRRI